ncbi:ATP-binding protein [Candidatus Babeliales bacterium]|nr:ATP-binding protein [Candidatus Babeliales bacterium]MCF7899076.1 ATP-binding protein [Candidatus Babeliales bacterium]
MKKVLKKLPVGISDFKKIIENNYYFVDKSLFIKDIIDSGAQVLLLPRPRRFGKTLNLSMLKYFFEKAQKSNKHLFKDLEIEKCNEHISYNEQYPVIFLTFKDITELDWQESFNKIKDLIGQEFKRHKYLLDSNFLDNNEKEIFKNIIARKAEQFDYENSLKNLTEYLNKFYNKKPILLIDEYDSPINAGFINNYYIQIISFMRGFLCGGLKDNSNLEKAVITGILRVARESIFSGLNNLEIFSILDEKFSEYFGFLQKDIEELLKYYNFKGDIGEVQYWYDGYNFGNKKIYNPWSILSFVSKDFKFSLYWVNTSDNQLIKDLISKGNYKLKKDLVDIIDNKDNSHVINENIVFADLESLSESAFNLLLFSGYLTISDYAYNKDKKSFCGKLFIPNEEIAGLYNNIIMYWFKKTIDTDDYNSMLEKLISGDIEEFARYFTNFVISSFSSFDLPENESEKIYHAFVLGMLVSLGKNYIVKSNRESGFGRYDVMLMPKDKNKLGVIIEFKKAYPEETIDHAVKAAIKQIEEKNYTQELKDFGIKNILSLGIAFKGKNVKILKK